MVSEFDTSAQPKKNPPSEQKLNFRSQAGWKLPGSMPEMKSTAFFFIFFLFLFWFFLLPFCWDFSGHGNLLLIIIPT